MKENVLKSKSLQFAILIVNLYKQLTGEHKEFVMSKQILRSGTAIGALVREAEHAESKADFIHKLAIAQKECNETLYWLELLSKTGYLLDTQYAELSQKAEELMKLLTSIIKTTKKNLNN